MDLANEIFNLQQQINSTIETFGQCTDEQCRKMDELMDQMSPDDMDKVAEMYSRSRSAEVEKQLQKDFDDLLEELYEF